MCQSSSYECITDNICVSICQTLSLSDYVSNLPRHCSLVHNPTCIQIQFWWTLRHLERPTAITLVTRRSSGASYLNRVELQNGCMALAHANLFIPSNLNGSCFDPQTGKVDQDRLRRNMDQATEIYISRCNRAPCGDAQIHLFKGADSGVKQELRSDVLVYLKGSRVEKDALKRDKPDRWKFIEDVWNMRTRHMTLGLPSQYVFLLKCCSTSNCSHPLCKQSIQLPSWYPGGPTFDYFPLPIPDPSCNWGKRGCSKCGDKVCYGHFLTPEVSLQSTCTAMMKPPSQILKEVFAKRRGNISDEDIQQLSKETLLPPEEVRIWIEHLQTIQANRKQGAEKAAATRQRKKANEKHYYCICGEEYSDVTDEIEYWIGCDSCSSWFHCDCAGVEPDSIPDIFLCSACSN